MTERDLHELDAAYVLGALIGDDRRAFEAHLATCERCTTSVGELAGMPGLLGLVDRDEAQAMLAPTSTSEHDSALVTRLASAAVRRRWRDRVIAGAGVIAAAAAIIAFAVFGPIAPKAVTDPLAGAVEMQQVDAGVMTAELVVTEKGWGSRFDWACSYSTAAVGGQYDGPLPTYVLVVIDDAGDEHTVASWSDTGSGHAGGLTASSGIPYDTIRAVEIRYDGSSDALVRTEL